MSEPSPSPSPPNKRRSWLQFSTRALFVLVVLAAITAWFANQYMVVEQRREELIAAIQSSSDSRLSLYPGAKVPWRRRLGAWLRGKPPTPGVDMASLQLADESSILTDFVEVFPNTLLHVRLDAAYASPEVLDALARSKKLDSLDLFGGPFDTSDESLSRLGKVRVNTTLSFAVERVDDDLLRRVAAAGIDPSSMWDLNGVDSYNWSMVTNDGLRTAARFRKLARLYAGPDANDNGVAAFRDHPNIDTVELVGAGYTDASADTIITLRQLKFLAFVDTNLSDAGIAKAIQERHLSSLKFDNVELGALSAAAIVSIPSLEHLELRHVRLTPEVVAAILTQPLVTLKLRGDYTDEDLNQLAPLAPKLMTIELNTPNVTDQGLAWLVDARQIFNLHLNDTKATAATMKIISTTNPYINIHLGGPNIDASVLAEAGQTFRLGMIWLSGPSIDDDALAAIGPPYISLSLAGTRTTVAGLLSLKTANDKLNRVVVFYPKDNTPPFNPTEVEQVKASVELELLPLHRTVYDRMLPDSSRRAASEAKAP